MLSRLAPGALFTGIAAAVVGLSKLHATQVGGYDYSGSSRFAWSIAYIVLLAVTMVISTLIPAGPDTNRKIKIPGSRFDKTPLPAGV